MEDQQNFMSDTYTLIDEEGNEQIFELLDKLEIDGQNYYAFTPYFENEEDYIEDDAALIVLKSEIVDDEEIMISIDDDEEYNRIGNLFLERIEQNMSEWFEEEDPQ